MNITEEESVNDFVKYTTQELVSYNIQIIVE